MEVQKRFHVEIRNLQLKEIALDSEIQSLARYPGDTRAAQAPIIQRRDEIRRQIAQAEERLSGELHTVDVETETRIAEAKRTVRAAAETSLREFRNEQERRVAAEVSSSKQLIDYVLASLEPLTAPAVPQGAAVPLQAVTSPAQVGATAKQAPQPDMAGVASRSAQGLLAERTRIVKFITEDVKRRLDRLSIQYRWQLAFTPTQGMADMTQEVADTLRGEWRP